MMEFLYACGLPFMGKPETQLPSPLQLHTLSWKFHGYLSGGIVSIKKTNSDCPEWDGSKRLME